MATKPKNNKGRKLTLTEKRELMRQKAKEQWADPTSKLRTAQRTGVSTKLRSRPPKHAVALIERAIGELGATKIALAAALGCAPLTFDRWLIRHPEIREAFDRAKAVEEAKLVGVLVNAATKDGGNWIAALAALKIRHGYRDSGPIPGEQNDPHATAAKVRAYLMEMRQRDALEIVEVQSVEITRRD